MLYIALKDRNGKPLSYEASTYPFDEITEALVRLLWTQVPGKAAGGLCTILGLDPEEALRRIERAYQNYLTPRCPHCNQILPPKEA